MSRRLSLDTTHNPTPKGKMKISVVIKENEREISLENGATVADMIRSVAGGYAKEIEVRRNGKRCGHKTTIRDGDILYLQGEP